MIGDEKACGELYVDVNLNAKLVKKLILTGLIPMPGDDRDVRSFNVGKSNYSHHLIQPWSIWIDYPELTSFDHDIIKRVLRDKEDEPRIMDYKKIIHICEERIRQIEYEEKLK